MLPNHILKKAWEQFSLLFLCHWFYLALLILHFFVFNGLRESEKIKLNLLRPGYSMIVTHTDKRIGNAFHSTPDYFLKLYQYVPEVDAILRTIPSEISFSYKANEQVHHVSRELPVLMVGASYFDAFQGRFIQGRGFTRNDIFAGKPMVVMSEGSLIKIFGDYNNAPTSITMNGLEFQVVGTWAFNSADIEENDSIFIPLGMVNLFGKSSNTYINNFIMKGTSSHVLERLKQGIDRIQIDAGIQPVRPNFTIASTGISKKVETIFIHNKAYVDVLIWIVFILYSLSSYKANEEWLSFSQEWVTWKFMAGHNFETFAKEAANSWLFMLTISFAGSVLMSLVVMSFLKITLRYNLSTGPLVHYSFLFYLLFLPIQYVLLQRTGKKLRYNLQ